MINNKNELLELTGKFDVEVGGTIGKRKLKNSITLSHIKDIYKNLKKLKTEWESKIKTKFEIEPLVWVYYKEIIAKTNRIKNLFPKNKNCFYEIVGAQFYRNKKENNDAHLITYHLNENCLNKSIENLDLIIKILEDSNIKETIDQDILDELEKKLKNKKNNSISITTFIGTIIDCYFIEKIGINWNDEKPILNEDLQIITFYKTDKSIAEILKNIDIEINELNKIDDYSYFLSTEQIKKIKENAGFLISMGAKNANELANEIINTEKQKHNFTIRKPDNEPIIGVIDSMFDQNAYFNEWVEYHDYLDKNESKLINEFTQHGTGISSIIVDGPNLNPWLDDNCGNFRVRHFGISNSKKIHVFNVIKNIEKIIKENKDIKVWNLSIGSIFPINNNFISLEASLIDELQVKYDVIFIVSGTNKSNNDNNVEKIGSPADTINGLVVNSCKKNNKPASYTRDGEVLSFFIKPDISYYGGDINEMLNVCSGSHISRVMGTSYAAAWITRKVAYLIYILGFSKEVAKALIVDSTINLSHKNNDINIQKQGFGIVPIKIDDIIYANKNEIKFVLNGASEYYKTTNLTLPVPIEDKKFPYVAKSTLCYFTECDRNQGVDYTTYELDMQFGPIQVKNGKYSIKSINDNRQTEDDDYTTEAVARNKFGKWNNIKMIIDYEYTEKNNQKQPMKIGPNDSWGFKIIKKSRKDNDLDRPKINFGLVVTLRNLHNKNKIHEFVQKCILNNWMVTRVDVHEKNKIFISSKDDIDLE